MQKINPLDEPTVRKALLSLGISQQLLANWRVRGVPLDRCAPIEIQSGHVVTRQMLRPNDWQIHWPELAAAGDCIACAAIESDSREA
jgi:DNA-binding transcriptional regulator YdaS (Cro superfamily)